MKTQAEKNEIIRKLRGEILAMEGVRTPDLGQPPKTGLGIIEQAFYGGVFPTGAVHEFISIAPQDVAAATGFMAGLASSLASKQGTCIWIGSYDLVFPPALKAYGVSPERFVFINSSGNKELLWATEEALRCPSVAMVIAEVPELSFTQSRRLQLAVEQSGVTGFIHRYRPRSENTVACTSRWKISPLPGHVYNHLPGVSFPRWDVQLLKVRNGTPGRWQVEWTADCFRSVSDQEFLIDQAHIQQTG